MDVPLGSYAATGKYEVTVNAGGEELGSGEFDVEEFVPERMEVKVAPTQADYKDGDHVAVDISARYLFGSTAAGERVELRCALHPATFTPPGLSDFRFGVWTEKAPKSVDLRTTTHELGENGAAQLPCPEAAQLGRIAGSAEFVATAAVFESGSGRSTQSSGKAWVHPERFYLGLRATGTAASAGQPLTVHGVVVDWAGKPVTDVAEVEVALQRLEEQFGWYYDEYEHNHSERRYLRPVTESQKTVKVQNGKFTVELTPQQDGGAFLVHAASGAAATDLRVEGKSTNFSFAGFDYPVESANEHTPKPQKPTPLKLTPPERATVNQPTSVKIRVPYRGYMLLTLETDRVLRAEWRRVEPGIATYTFTVPEFMPNVYVSALVVKDPHLESKAAFLAERAFGVVSIPLERSAYALGVKVSAPTEVRSQSRFEVKLKLDKPATEAFATIAVVDEGILSLSKQGVPDPLTQIIRRCKLEVETFETVGWSLLLPASGPARRTGGDGGPDEKKDGPGRVDAIKPVSMWSGVVKVGANGELNVPFTLPPYRGAVRIIAVAVTKTQVGTASARMLVRDPLMLQATLPRFLVAGDEITVPVAVTNLTGAGQTVAIRMSTEELPVPGLVAPPGDTAPVTIVGETQAALTLDSTAASTVRFRLRANRAFGAARVKVVAKAGTHESHEEADVPLQPSGSRERVVQRVELTPGAKIDLKQYMQGWIPGTERSTFWVTSNPYGDVFDHLSHLVKYPYGCIEQTTSSTRPLLFIANLIKYVDPTLVSHAKIEDLVAHGIDRVFSMQTSEGGFAFWPGETTPYLWGTAYATHMLLDAKKAGFKVPEQRLQRVLDFIEGELKDKLEAGKRDYASHYSGDPEPYMQLVMALAGRPRKARLQKLANDLSRSLVGESNEHPLLIKAALYLSGDRRYEPDLRQPDIGPVDEKRWNDWSLYSDRRRRGQMLSILHDLFGTVPDLDPLADVVAKSLRGKPSYYYTTQELVWGITGLGKYLGQRKKDIPLPTLSANGKALPLDKNMEKGDKAWSLYRASEYKTLSLEMPPGETDKLYLFISGEGIRQKPNTANLPTGLNLERRFVRLDGSADRPVNLADGSVKLGELIYVHLKIENSTSEAVQNIALVDRLPAGFEIENPRVGRDQRLQWLEEDALWQPEHMNLRDDRVEIFGELPERAQKSIVYAVRAVTAGRFSLPMATAEAMYDPAVGGHVAGGTVVISGPAPAAAPAPNPTPSPTPAATPAPAK